MIIGISGKVGLGKDTVGKIVQGLIIGENKFKDGIIGFLDSYDDYLSYPNKEWEIKKFADKLKDIVCLLIGCTREQLEDREFKEKELGEEWWKVFYGTGQYAYEKGKNRLERGYDIGIKLTPRLLLQLLGTECGRQIIHPNIWVNALMSEYKSLYGYQTTDSKINIEGISIPIPVLDIDKRVFPNWIITDVRFPNELEAVKKRGGISIRVNRNPFKWIEPDEYEVETGKKVERIIEHESETALDNAEFDYVIENDGTIEDLIQKVKEILVKEQLL